MDVSVSVLVKVVVVVDVWVIVVVVFAAEFPTTKVVVVDAVAELVAADTVTVFVFLAVTVVVRGIIVSTSTLQNTFEGYLRWNQPMPRQWDGAAAVSRTTRAPPCLTAGSRWRTLRPPSVGVG